MGTQERVVLVAGALTVAVVVFGLAVVEANTGPFEHEVEAVEVSTALEGTYIVRQGSASAVCSSVEEVCDPETELVLAIEGLPRLAGDARYGAFLAEGERVQALDVLDPGEEEHRLTVVRSIDGDAYDALVLGLVDASEPRRLVFALHELELPTSGGERVPVAADVQASLAPARGELSLAQIGAVEVAVTAEASIEGLPAARDWSYEAWLVDEDTRTSTWLGSLAQDDEGESHRFDARIARLTLADQDRFLLTLHAPSSSTPGEPLGFPVADVPVEADSLFR